MSSNAAALSAKPRVRVAPRSVTNEADDAIFLASSYGLTPDDWQEDILESWLGRRRDGRWSAATCGLAVPRQNGKNGAIEVRELFGMIALGEKFLHTAHEVKTARKAFRRIASFFDESAGAPKELAALVVEIRKTNGQEAVVLRNGGSVEFIARSKGSGRGYTVDVLVLDEAQDLKDEELEALLPTISASPTRNPQVILTGTPPDPEKGQTGEVFSRIRREHKQDARLAWTDFGVPDGALPDVDDRATWQRANPALAGRLNIAEVERERRMMSPEGFARERLGWWGNPNQATSVAFGSGVWDACAREDLDPVADAIGLAVSWDRSVSSIGAAGRVGEKTAVGVVDRREGTGWLVPEAKRIQAERHCAVVIDGRGPASDLIPALEAAGVRLVITKTNDVLDACASIFDAAQDGRLMHPNHPDLNTAVSGAHKREVMERWAWARKRSVGDVSMLEAVTLAFWGASQSTESIYEQRGMVTL